MLNIQRYVNIMFAVLVVILLMYVARLYMLSEIQKVQKTVEAQEEAINVLRGDIDQIVDFLNQQPQE